MWPIHLTIGKRIAVGFVAPLTIFLAAATFTYHNMEKAHEDVSRSITVSADFASIASMDATFAKLRREAISYNTSATQTSLDLIRALQLRFSEHRHALDASQLPGEQKALLERVLSNYDRYNDYLEALVEKQKKFQEVTTNYMRPLGMKIQSELGAVIRDMIAQGDIGAAASLGLAYESLSAARYNASLYGFETDQKFATAAERAAEQFVTALAALKSTHLSDKSQRRLDDLISIAAQYIAGMKTSNNAKAEKIALVQGSMSTAASDLGKDFVRLSSAQQSELASYNQRSLSSILSTIWLSGYGYVAAIVFSILLASLIGRSISKPIKEMTLAMTSLANGQLNIEIPGGTRTDEVGAMSAAVATFKNGAVERAKLEAAAREHQGVVDRERATREAEKEAESTRIAEVIQALQQGLAALSNGDLTKRIDFQFPERLESLRNDFNSTITKLAATIASVTDSTNAIKSGTAEIATASEDLSRRTEQQAASLEESVGALGGITSTVRKTAEGAREARQAVANAKSSAEGGGEVVRQAVDAMERIEKSSQQIGQIIGVIDEIAFQTNLLALNAGVEAARAGDAGRGFAVVASEVRALAQRSADAAKEIKGLISTSAKEVGEGVKFVAQTGQSLDLIIGMVSEINKAVTTIAATAEEQATSLQQVNSSINEMDQVTQQNAAMAEQASAASRSLATEGEQLARLVGSFRTGGAPCDLPRAEPKAVAPHKLQIGLMASSNRSKPQVGPVRAMNPRRKSPAAVVVESPRKKIAAAGSNDGWEEF